MDTAITKKYLLESGAPEITHGLCPNCAAEMSEEIKFLKEQGRKVSMA